MRGDAFCPISVEILTLAELEADLASAEADERVVLVGSRVMVERLGLGGAIAALGEACDLIWLDADYANPTQADVTDALVAIGPGRPSRIICIGGGSSIDVGKGISALYDVVSEPTLEAVKARIADKSYARDLRGIDITAIPTTAGTGSEVTKWATIWDVDGEAKYSIDDAALYPKRALVCTDLTLTMPPRLMLSTALDALSHAMEAFWARPSDALVKAVSMSSVREIQRHLPVAIADPQDRVARDGLCLGSILAGIAFSNTRTTACHSISYPMTMRYNVPHGFAAAMTLPQVAAVNLSAVPEIADLLGVFGGAEGFSAWMKGVCEGLQELTLSALGIGEGDIDTLVEMAFTAGRMDNNPVDITPEQVRSILLQVL